MLGTLLGERQYSLSDQIRFAELTGDYNPLHVDPVAARRALFGEPVVHGMHNVIWAIEKYLANTPVGITHLSVTFAKPAFLNETVSIRLVEEKQGSARLQVTRGELTLTDVKLRHSGVGSLAGNDRRARGVYRRTPLMRALRDLEGLSDCLAIYEDDGALARAFPATCATLGRGVVAQLLALTRLVGMESPGLYSIFAECRLEIVPDTGIDGLRYTVSRVDPRFSMAEMRVETNNLRGSLGVFLRPAPASQMTVAEVAGRVAPGEFAGQRALIVGGSRGLGELMAKIIACGGGYPLITYRDGADDARRVAEEIDAGRGRCGVVQLDAAAAQISLPNAFHPTHLYYFATPRIFVRKSGLFDTEIFRRFIAIYVDGFLRSYQACRQVAQGPLRVFYPSSVALDEDLRELSEYTAAKAAGEALCRQIAKYEKGVSILVERLPRLPTDQTATIMEVAAADAAETMLRVARAMGES